MTVIALEKIRHNGEDFEAGEVIEGLNEEAEKRLVKLKSAEYPKASTRQVNDSDNGNSDDDLTPDQYKELHDKLDKAFNKEPLIEAAEKAGVELTDENKKLKDSVIEEIILQSKEEEVLALKEE